MTEISCYQKKVFVIQFSTHWSTTRCLNTLQKSLQKHQSVEGSFRNVSFPTQTEVLSTRLLPKSQGDACHLEAEKTLLPVFNLTVTHKHVQ